MATRIKNRSMQGSMDYHAHISKVQRSPSILTDVPRYPNAHLAFNRKAAHDEDEGDHRHHNPQAGERIVEVTEYEEVTNPGNGFGEVIYEEESVDAETDEQYYRPRRNRAGFELQKWKTFRP